MLSYDLYWSFRSPCSYLVTPRLMALQREFDVQCVVGGVWGSDGSASPPSRRRKWRRNRRAIVARRMVWVTDL
jgi:2-hydroxychromene-2-carboxylate isomerase